MHTDSVSDRDSSLRSVRVGLLSVRRCLPERVRRTLEARHRLLLEERQHSRGTKVDFPARPSLERRSFDERDSAVPLGRLLPLPITRQATSDPGGADPALSRGASTALARLRTTEEPYELTFRDCSYEVRVPSREGTACGCDRSVCKPILHAVSGSVAAGKVLAVLGPSGAGKTTLLSMLTLERRGGVGVGDIALGGQPLTTEAYRRHCAVVQQQDHHWACLSARDHLRYALQLYRPHLRPSERRAATEQLLEATGLVGCQHTRAGSALVPITGGGGLSSGQRRRLSLAIALTKQPSMIFLDEPTSGLDSAAAAKIMHFLKVTAKQTNIPILCTIHQPSASVYEGFDDVLVLAAGRVAYFGAAAQMGGHLDRLGHPLPSTANPAEFMLDLINRDFSSPEAVDAILDAWEEEGRGEEVARPPTRAIMTRPPRRARQEAQLWILLRRHALLALREPMLYTGRLGLILSANAFISMVYFHTREQVQEQVVYRLYLFAFTLVVPLVFHAVVVVALNNEFSAIRREIKEGMYGPLPYVLATTAVQAAMAFALAVCSLLPAYAITLLPWSSFPVAVPVVAAMLVAYECLAQLCSHVPSVLLGMVLYLIAFLITFLFSGLFVKQSAVHYPLRPLLLASPMRLGYAAFSKVVFEASPPYGGALECEDCPIALRIFGRCGNKLPPEEQLQCDAQTDEFPRGFYCPGSTILQCFGITGEQILRTLSFMYDAADADCDVYAATAKMLLMALALKLLYLSVFVLRCRAGDPPAPRQHGGAARALGGTPPPSEPRTTIGRKTLARVASVERATPPSTPPPSSERTSARLSSRSTEGSHVVAPPDSPAAAAVARFASFDPAARRPSMDRLRTNRTPYELTLLDCSYDIRVSEAAAAGGRHGARRAASLQSCLPSTLCLGSTRPKQLLRDVSACVRAGHVLAVLGPSGAGKTTLLSMLTLERGPGTARGSVTLNGQPLTPDRFTRYCAVVGNAEDHWPFLTARDHLRYAIDLHRPSLSRQSRRAKVAQLLEATGLSACRHTRAGSAFVPGLSSGQRRRLSLAIALTKQPSMIFLDEPTSGLDSAAAAKIMHFLKVTAKQTNIPILCTIHQPSASVYEGFDDVLVLAAGRVAYFGAAAQMGRYLETLGTPLPPNANPAEFILDLVNADFTDAASVHAILAEWPRRSQRPVQRAPVRIESGPRRATFCEQLCALAHRHARLTVREPLLYVSRAVLNGGTMSFFCSIYSDTRRLEQGQVLSKSFFYFWMVAIPSSFSLLAVYALNLEFAHVRREVKNGMYSPMAYVLATSALQVPMVFAVCLCGLLPSYALLVGPSSWGSFPLVLLVCTANLWAFECIAQFFSLVSNPLLGMLQCLSVWIWSLLFCGLTIQGRDIIWPVRLLYYALPLKWALSTAIYEVAVHCPDYEGTFECDVGDDPTCPSRGFKCESTPEDPLGVICFGRNATQIMATMNQQFPAFSTEDSSARDLSVLLLIGSVFKIGYVVILHLKCKMGRQPEPPGAASEKV